MKRPTAHPDLNNQQETPQASQKGKG